MACQVVEFFLSWPLMCHVAVVFLVLWLAAFVEAGFSVVLLLAFVFLYQVEFRQRSRISREIRFEERKSADRKKLSDDESVAWLNDVLEKIWPICLERLASQEFFMRLAPWFLEKYKPWTAKKAVLHHLDLGSRPPLFTSVSSRKPADGYTAVLDANLNFVAAADMNAVLAVQLRKWLGFGMWTNLHLSRFHLEGKLRVGIKLLPEFPFLERICLCFENAPHVQLRVCPIINHGVNMAELPVIASWLDKILAYALDSSLVEPNMLVINVEKLLQSFMPFRELTSRCQPADWLYVEAKPPIALVRLEILEAKNLKPSDLNGLADPFVKGALGLSRFKTSVKYKTLAPVWKEEFKIPVSSWDLPDWLVLRVRDKDRFHDDELGYCVLRIGNFRGGERHLVWNQLQGVKMGKLLLAVTIQEKISVPVTADQTVGRESDDGGSTETRVQAPSKVAQDKSQENGIDGADSSAILKGDEYEEVELGDGREGMVSILHPGQKETRKHSDADKKILQDIVNDLYLAGDGLVDKSISKLGGFRLNAEKTDSDSNCSDVDENFEKGSHKKRNFWHWRSRKRGEQQGTSQAAELDPFGSCMQQGTRSEETQSLGHRGTQVGMKLEPYMEEHVVGTKGFHWHDSEEEEGEAWRTSDGKEQVHEKGKMKKLGKGLLHQAEKTASHLHHAKNQIQQMMQRRSAGKGNTSVPASSTAPTESMEGRGCDEAAADCEDCSDGLS